MKLLMNIKRIILFIIIAGIFLLNLYMWFFKSNSDRYSITRNWQEYHKLENWDLSSIARIDLDNDGQIDAVAYDSCAVLSSVTADQIPADRQCNQPDSYPHAYYGEGNEKTLGTQLTKPEDYHYQWLRQSFLVQTNENRWRFYEFNGLQVRAFELNDHHIFQPIKPSFLDYIDAFYFQLSHIVIYPIILLPTLFISPVK